MKNQRTFIPRMKHVRSYDVGDYTLFQIGRSVDRRKLIGKYAVHTRDSACYMGISFYSLCRNCGLHNACYTIVSYDTVIFQSCVNCPYVALDTRYFSTTTTLLQKAIAEAYGLEKQWNATSQDRTIARRNSKKGATA